MREFHTRLANHPLARVPERSETLRLMPSFCIIPTQEHNDLVRAAYLHRGYTAAEAEDAARFCEMASAHGIRTHNAIKALHLDHLFGSATGGCVPGAEIEVITKKFAASEVWDAKLKLGQSVAFRAMERCMELADQYGIGQVSVDNAFHYLWGGGYVMDAAKKGYIAYTNCTSTLGEVVPFGGKFPVLGTNPHSWGLPTQDACGYPVVIDWATSTVAMGRVQQLKREGKPLPPGAAVDAAGQPTTDANEAAWLLPFGAHKGYGLSLLIELMGGMIGGSLPTLRGGGAHRGAHCGRVNRSVAQLAARLQAAEEKENCQSMEGHLDPSFCKYEQNSIQYVEANANDERPEVASAAEDAEQYQNEGCTHGQCKHYQLACSPNFRAV